MPKLVAVHNIVFSEADNIQPKHVFVATAEEAEFLKSRDAAVAFNADVHKGLPEFVRPGATASKAETNEDGLPKVAANMKKADLIAIAKAEEIEVDESASNAALVKAIEDGRKAKEDLV